MLGGSAENLRRDLMPQTMRVEPVEENLKRRRDEMMQSLDDINKAIAALEKQPDLLDTLNLLRRVGI